MKYHILKLYYQYRPEKEPEDFRSISDSFDLSWHFDALPYFLRNMVEEWIENYVELGGPREFCSRQVAAMLFMIWKKHHNDYQ